MYTVETKTGNYEIIASGQFILLSEGESSISITKGGEKLKFTFLFKEDDSKEPKLQNDLISDKELSFSFFNFNNSLGLGNTVPLEVGSLDGKKLLFSYRVFSLTDKNLRTLEYTFYSE